MHLVAHPLIERLGWTLLHSLWQGALIVLVYALLRALLRERGPEARYALSLGAFALLALAPLATFVALGDGAAAGATVTTAAATLGAELLVLGAGAAEAAPADLASLLAPYLPLIVAAWGAGVLVSALRVVGAWRHLGALRRSALPLGGSELAALVERLRHELGIARLVRVARSTLVDSPTVIGWLEPLVLVPTSALAGLTPQQLAMILAHELAHIRRHDYLVNAVQTAVETLLFYHPAVHWVSAKLRHEREECCDAIAVQHGGDAVAYARALAELEELRGLSASLALAATGGELLERIQRLLGQRPRQQRGTALASACAFATLTALVAGLALPDLLPAEPELDAMPIAAVAAPAPTATPTAASAGTLAVLPRTPSPAPAPRALARRTVAAAPAPEPIVAQATVLAEAAPALEQPAAPPESGAGLLSFDMPSYDALATEPTSQSGSGPVVSGGELLVGVAPQFPHGARRRGLSGSVSARITVDAAGRTVDVEILESQPARAFDRAVIRAASNWRFAPYLVDGKPTGRSFVQSFDFTGGAQGCEPVTGTRFCRTLEERLGKKGEGVRVIRLN